MLKNVGGKKEKVRVFFYGGFYIPEYLYGKETTATGEELKALMLSEAFKQLAYTTTLEFKGKDIKQENIIRWLEEDGSVILGLESMMEGDNGICPYEIRIEAEVER